MAESDLLRPIEPRQTVTAEANALVSWFVHDVIRPIAFMHCTLPAYFIAMVMTLPTKSLDSLRATL